jgi:hypothetical protein
MKLAVSFEIRIFLVVMLVGMISVLVILDQPETEVDYPQIQQYSQIQTTAKVMQGLQQPGEPVNTLTITGIDIGQSIGYKTPGITGNEFACMADRKIQTNEGRTTVRYSLLLRDPSVGGFNGCFIDYTKNEQNVQGLFMRCPSDEDMLAFLIQFDSGLNSKLDGNDLKDLDEKDLPMLGAMYTIINAEVDTDAKIVSLRLMGPAGVLDIKDKYDDNIFSESIKANGQEIMVGRVKINAVYSGNVFSISRIEYRLKPLPIVGKDLYVEDHHGTKQYLRTPAGFFGDFDILFRGLQGTLPAAAPVKKSYTSDLQTNNIIAFKSAGNVKYNMIFTNIKGQYYKFPLVYDTGAGLKWGDATKDFYFFSGPIPAIPVHSLIALNSKNNKRGVTNIVEYSSVDMDGSQAYFKDWAGRDTAPPFDPATGAGQVTFSGYEYNFVVDLVSPDHPIAIDQDGDGALGGLANLVSLGGVRTILNPGFTGQVYVESSLFAEGGGPEATGFAFTPGIDADITGGVQMLYDDATDMNEGLTGFGIFVQQTTQKTTGRNLIFNLPSGQLSSKVGVVSTPSTKGQAQGEVLITCERSEFVKAQAAAQAAFQ